VNPSDPNTPAYGAPPDTSSQVANSTLLEADRLPDYTKQKVMTSANWFFWIAALSLVNSVVAHSGSQWHFFLGLGMTEVVDVVAGQFGGVGMAIAIMFDLLAATVFAGFGLLARRMLLWPFVAGMVVYLLDGGLLLAVGEYFGAAFHAYALYAIFVGFNALRESRSATT
jgi:hypothetical protein